MSCRLRFLLINSIIAATRQVKLAVQIRNGAIAIVILLCLPSTNASAAAISWNSLSPVQQEALTPLSQQWDTLSEQQRNRLLKTTKTYSKLTPEHKQRFRDRLTAWSKLTPEQRKAAREKYRAFKKLPPEQREEVKRMVKQEQTNKTQQATSGVPAAPSVSSP